MQIELIILIAGFSYWLAALSGIPKYVSDVLFNFGVRKGFQGGYIPIRLYPFDCEKCLGFWLGLYCFWSSEYYILIAGFVSLVTMVLGFIINKIR